MPLRKTEAIVLKSIKLGETSKILTLYTRSKGKLKVVAKGARSTKSRFAGNLELANYISIVFYEKENRDLQTLSQAEILTAFSKDSTNLERTTLMMAVCEFVDRLETGSTPSPLMFKLLLESLKCMQSASDNPMNCLRAFQVRVLDALGIRPKLNRCLQCGSPSRSEVVFDVVRGGFVCENCRQPASQGMILSLESMNALLSFQTKAMGQLNGLLPSTAPQQQVDRLLAAYLQYHVDEFRELNALKFYKKIVNRETS
ncbi:MAG: DNA repair protein RecO [bacterium]